MSFRPSNIEPVLAIEALLHGKDAVLRFVHLESGPYQQIKETLRNLYLSDERPWLVGFSGGKDSTMVASLIFDVVSKIPVEQRKKPISVVCTDTRVEIPAIAEMIEGTLSRMRKFSEANSLNIDVNLLMPEIEQSFWVNIIGRGYPPPNRTFRWCTQRMKIDPVFAKQQLRAMK